jgi:hypothetical protein
LRVGAPMTRLDHALAAAFLAVLSPACGQDTTASPAADSSPATGPASDARAADVTVDLAAGKDTAGTIPGDAGAGPGDAPAASDTGKDMPGGDSPGSGFRPPVYPPRGMASCASGCAALRASYADAVLAAQRCSAGAAGACAQKAPSGLGCNSCEVWVNDARPLVPIANQFNDLGCYGCYFGGPGGEFRCHAVGCADLDTPVCAPQGTCTNQMKDRTCPPGLMTGTPCTSPTDYCIGGSHISCYCQPGKPNWMCVQ